VNDQDAFPNSYDEWRHCIEVRGGIRLTPNYISQRLEELLNDKHVKTQEFARLYGDDRLHMTIKWFRRASDDLSGKRA